MNLKTLTYTSEARDGLADGELERIHASAMTLNALDGVTGMLVHNGSQFLQIIEGSHEAIDDLIGRLRSDTRHTNVAVRHEGAARERSFPDWSMALVRVSRGRFEARSEIERGLPATMPGEARSLILAMSELISG